MTPVPYSKWIQVTQFCHGMSDNSVPMAKLLYYSKKSACSGIGALDLYLHVGADAQPESTQNANNRQLEADYYSILSGSVPPCVHQMEL